MKMSFKKEVEFTTLNCPYFTGIQEHGTKVMFDLGYEMCEELKLYSDRNSLHIHQDRTMYITTMHYNYGREEWVEKIEIDLTNNQEFITLFNKWLEENNLFRSTLFPYTISTERNWHSVEMANNLENLITYLKTKEGEFKAKNN